MQNETPHISFNQLLSGATSPRYVRQATPYADQVEQAAKLIEAADAVIIGAGAGLSTAAGLTYSGPRFTENFREFITKYGFEAMPNMYSAGFYPFPTPEAMWGYWSKHAWMNRIAPEALPVYCQVHDLVADKPHFVLTTNVDHQFWKAGFADEEIFATQGDYGEIQCSVGCHDKVYDAVDLFNQMNQARRDCVVPTYMVPKCPVCGRDMAMHLRCDNTFIEDEHWHAAAQRYIDFLQANKGKRVVMLELGVGFNTPIIIRLPFEQMLRENKDWSLVRLNLGEAFVPQEAGLADARMVGIDADIAQSVNDIVSKVHHD